MKEAARTRKKLHIGSISGVQLFLFVFFEYFFDDLVCVHSA